MTITDVSMLRQFYGHPSPRAVKKQLSALDEHCVRFIQNSPFMVLSTVDDKGQMDCSPRGGNPGFIRLLGKTQLIIPDAKGNNRLDSLENIIVTGRVGCLFFIPGMDETLRLNGSATINVSPEHIDLFSNERHTPAACIVLDVEEVFLHCAKALMRSKLWSAESQVNRSEHPSMGEILNDQIAEDARIETQEEMVERYKKDI